MEYKIQYYIEGDATSTETPVTITCNNIPELNRAYMEISNTPGAVLVMQEG